MCSKYYTYYNFSYYYLSLSATSIIYTIAFFYSKKITTCYIYLWEYTIIKPYLGYFMQNSDNHHSKPNIPWFGHNDSW